MGTYLGENKKIIGELYLGITIKKIVHLKSRKKIFIGENDHYDNGKKSPICNNELTEFTIASTDEIVKIISKNISTPYNHYLVVNYDKQLYANEILLIK